MESTELMPVNTGIIRSVDDLARIGTMMSKSGYFIDARDAAQAAVKVQAGLEMGFGPFASMTGIHIIKGRPSVGANLMASAVKSNPKYDYRVKKMEDKEVQIEFFEIIDGKRVSIGVSSFTAAEAQKAGTQNMDKFPRNMLFARAMSNGIRWFCPDVFAGNPTYTPEELGADVDDEGIVVSVPQTAPVITVEPVIAETAPENAPAPQKPGLDPEQILREWKHRVKVDGTDIDLSPTNLETASETTTSKGKLFAACDVKELWMMWIAYTNRVKNPNNAPEIKEDALMKLSAINEILTAKASAQAELDKQPGPFLGGE